MPGAWDRHLDEEQAEKYSMGALSEEEEARCEEHLLVCTSCRQQVDSADRYAGAMKSAAAAVQLQPRRRPRFNWFVSRPAWALGLAFLVIGGVFLAKYQAGGPPVAVHLSAMRGAQPGATAPAGTDMLLFADLTGLPPTAAYRLELVDLNGRLLWSGPFAAGGVKAPGQRAGVYFVRLRSAGGELLREYGLEVAKTPAASNVPR